MGAPKKIPKDSPCKDQMEALPTSCGDGSKTIYKCFGECMKGADIPMPDPESESGVECGAMQSAFCDCGVGCTEGESDECKAALNELLSCTLSTKELGCPELTCPGL